MEAKRRILGWYFFDWASQPYHTVLLTFVFGPFFAAIATEYFAGTGLDEQAADARAQSLWSLCLTISGLIVGLGAPFLGALADTSGRRLPWIAVFSVIYVLGASALWLTEPDGSNLGFALAAFAIGFVAAEYALIFTNAQLPGLIDRAEVGRVSGSGFAFGYLGGLIALILALALLVEQASARTLIGIAPGFGLLDAEAREGTRFVGPFVALWFAAFMIPYFRWVREEPERPGRASFRDAMGHVGASVRDLRGRGSLASFLGGSMLYRDALNGLYGFGGTYALLVLNWEITRIGIFGIISVISAAVLSWIGGRLDRYFGPKPVIIGAVLGLIVVCATIAGMSREAVFGVAIAPDSGLPDAIFLACGVLIGGLGGIVQAASRSLMVRHLDPGGETAGFGLYGLAGRATAFLAPALIGLVTVTTGDVRNGVLPLIALFLLGLLLLRWTKPEGDRADPWSKP
ncbi:MAG: MFS transporter [Paracoccaceae bacterium]|nr:MFS transporter [Paracoccaceae bacterium]